MVRVVTFLYDVAAYMPTALFIVVKRSILVFCILVAAESIASELLLGLITIWISLEKVFQSDSTLRICASVCVSSVGGRPKV